MERRKTARRRLAGKPEGKSHLEELGVDGGISIKINSHKAEWELGLG